MSQMEEKNQQEHNSPGLSRGFLQIKSHIQDLNPSEKKVADYVLENAGEVVYTSITELAGLINVSEATVVKFCQSIGLSGYQELKIMLARDGGKAGKKERIYGEIEKGDSLEDAEDKLFQMYEESLASTRRLLECEAVEEAAEQLLDADQRYFFGYGASALVAEDAELKFRRIALPATAVSKVHDQKMIAANLGEDDVVVAISDSGRTRELLEAVDILKKNGCRVIAITSQAGSPLAEKADRLLLNYSQESPFRGSAMASRLAQLSVIDMLFLGAALARYDSTNEALKRTREAVQSSKLTP